MFLHRIDNLRQQKYVKPSLQSTEFKKKMVHKFYFILDVFKWLELYITYLI